MMEINVSELLFIGLKYGLLIAGITGIFSLGIKYALKFLQEIK